MRKSSSVQSRLHALNSKGSTKDPSVEILRKQQELYKLFHPNKQQDSPQLELAKFSAPTKPQRTLIIDPKDLAANFGLKQSPTPKAVYSQKYQVFLQDCKNIIHDVRRRKLDLSLRSLNPSSSSENVQHAGEFEAVAAVTRSSSRGYMLNNGNKQVLEQTSSSQSGSFFTNKPSQRVLTLEDLRKRGHESSTVGSTFFREIAIQDLTKLINIIKDNRQNKQSERRRNFTAVIGPDNLETHTASNHFETMRPVRGQNPTSVSNLESKKFDFLKSQAKLCQENFFSPRHTKGFNPTAFLSKAFPSRV